MHPGLTVLCLHGHMKQHQRMEVYHSFSRKQHAVLLATDVAARGLDFPVVNWVVQMDKPENTDTYIHRVGRTARYEKSGEALLVLLPAEEKKMVEELNRRKIPIVKLKVSKKRVFDVTKKLESICASDKDMKDNAQKVGNLLFKLLALLPLLLSLGLVQAPRLPFLEKSTKSGNKEERLVESTTANPGEKEEEEESDDDDDSSDEDDSEGDEEDETKRSAVNSTGPTLNFGVVSDDEDGSDGDKDDGIYKVIKNVTEEPEEQEDSNIALVEDGGSRKKKSRAKEKLKLLKYTKRVVFDEDGNLEKEESEDEEQGLNINAAKQRMKDQDRLDKEEQRRRIREMHREKRLKLKEKRRQAELEKRGQEPEETEVSLGPEDSGKGGNDASDDDQQRSDDDEDGDKDDDQTAESDSDEEPSRKRPRLEADESGSEEEETEDDASDDNEDDESDAPTQTIADEEEAVLALLGGKT
ncbi:RNA helicase [Elysia marginata]|uniref:ATP-dependent RNA helicase n=1 Tax=Elysia marginata TaxID=1093978 RepID=A0AAV4EH93_9GAST|nr:RNA helicase [Elysia marginata]